jgi:hypothetical protein
MAIKFFSKPPKILRAIVVGTVLVIGTAEL